MATIKKGTYRFNDVLTLEQFDSSAKISYNVTLVQLSEETEEFVSRKNNGYAIYVTNDYMTYYTDFADVYIYNANSGWSTRHGEDGKIITITEDAEVSAEFAAWFNANAAEVIEEPDAAATISYNGSVIASLTGGQKATMKCRGMVMEDDVVVEVVDGAGGGSCSGTHVIEVDELPTENIDENALYKVGDTYHRYGGELLDVLVAEYHGLRVGSLVDAIKAGGTAVELFYVKTKPTENIKETNDNIYNVYYVEDEDDIFVYTNGMWLTVSTALGRPYFKTVSSIDDIGETDEYTEVLCALIYTGWKDYPWTNGTLTIEEVGTHNVTDKKEVNVNIGAVAGVWKFEQYGVFENNNISSWTKFQSVNFTTTINGEVVYCTGIERYDDRKAGGCTMRYKLNDGSYYDAWGSLAEPQWKDEGCKTIDFGTVPQNVSGEFLAELSKVATQQESTPGGGSPNVVEKDVNFYDYDGTLLHSYTVAEAQALTELPPLPTQEGLICQGWNYDLETIKEYNSPVDVGATYITDDGRTRLHINVDSEHRKEVKINIDQSVANGVNVDWGDGSAIESNSTSGKVTFIHEYASVGDYVISIGVANGCTFKLGHGAASTTLMGDSADKFRMYTNKLKKVNMGEGAATRSSAFRGCHRLESVSLSIGSIWASDYVFNSCSSLRCVVVPYDFTGVMGSYGWSSCASLKTISLPNGITSLNGSNFASCEQLKKAVLPKTILQPQAQLFSACRKLKKFAFHSNVTSIGAMFFQGCYSLESVVLPESLTSFPSSGFSSCYSMTHIKVPKGVSSIPSSAFSSCYSMKIYDFSEHETVPTLLATNAFSGIPSDCEIRVPMARVDEWKAATNWSTYASQIVGV